MAEMLTLIKTHGPQSGTFMAQEVIKTKSIPSAGKPGSVSAGAWRVFITQVSRVEGRYTFVGSSCGSYDDGQRFCWFAQSD